MFDKIKNFLSTSWKKLLVAVIAGVLSFLLLKFVLAPFLSLGVVSLAGGIGIGYLVYTKVALWEIEKLAAKVGVKVDL